MQKPPVPGQKQMRGDEMWIFNGDYWRYAGKYQSARECIVMGLGVVGWTEEQIDDILAIIKQGPE